MLSSVNFRDFVIWLVGCFLLMGCAPGFKGRPVSAPVMGEYCTSWIKYGSANSSFGVSCLREDGSWTALGRPVDISVKCGLEKKSRFGNPHLSLTSSNKPMIGYKRCPGFTDAKMILRQMNAFGNWKVIGGTVNLDAENKHIPIYSQFGGAYFEFKGDYFSFWTSSGKAFFSKLVDSKWSHSESLEAGLVRHPEVYKTNEKAFIYYGQPKPTVWEVTSGVPDSIGTVGIDPDLEYTLYTSLVEWNGSLVIAYTTADKDESWENTISEVKVAFHDGGSVWQINAASVQDTPGHDGVNPFLFVIGGELHIMYSDYTTGGFRFRVKKWNGSSWDGVGTESPPLLPSQRFEFSLDGNAVLFSAIQWKVLGVSSEQIVLKWENGEFLQIGNAVKEFTVSEGLGRPRPGNVICPK